MAGWALLIIGACVGSFITIVCMIWGWWFDHKAAKERLREEEFKLIWEEIDKLKFEVGCLEAQNFPKNSVRLP